MLSLNAEGRGLVLPQLNGPGFIDSPRKDLPFGRNGWGVGWGKVREGGRRSGKEKWGWNVK